MYQRLSNVLVSTVCIQTLNYIIIIKHGLFAVKIYCDLETALTLIDFANTYKCQVTVTGRVSLNCATPVCRAHNTTDLGLNVGLQV